MTSVELPFHKPLVCTSTTTYRESTRRKLRTFPETDKLLLAQGIRDFTGTETFAKELEEVKFLGAPTHHPCRWRLKKSLVILVCVKPSTNWIFGVLRRNRTLMGAFSSCIVTYT